MARRLRRLPDRVGRVGRYRARWGRVGRYRARRGRIGRCFAPGFGPTGTGAGAPASGTSTSGTSAAGLGDVRIRPCGRSRSRTVIEFHAPHGMAAIRLGTAALRRFLQRSYAVVEPGSEAVGPDLDRGLISLLGGV
ncbi:SsgA family sporulation/cell division regulator [Streptomyces sp. NPDC057301]|uniref:SsgA family sporulation/cell division regulator n=1 Tax=Streptomyces sp. NPDC057301 TaxID=3346093 RepID=UPI0036266459